MNVVNTIVLLLLCSLQLVAAPAQAMPVAERMAMTIYLAGDSTMAEKLPARRPETGWGEMLQNFFQSNTVIVENHARNGRSTRSFIEEKLWQRLIEKLTPGDYVFIQFGHNDSAKAKTERYTTPPDYRVTLIRFVTEVRERKAFPVLLTPVVRRRFDAGGNFYDTHGEYPGIVRSVAAEYQVPLIDMHRKSEIVLKQKGPEGSRKLFLQLGASEHANYPEGIEDNTHFNLLGAEVMAELVVEGIKETKLKLSEYLKK